MAVGAFSMSPDQHDCNNNMKWTAAIKSIIAMELLQDWIHKIVMK